MSLTLMHIVVKARKFVDASPSDISHELRRQLPNPLSEPDPLSSDSRYLRRLHAVADALGRLENYAKPDEKISLRMFKNELDSQLSPPVGNFVTFSSRGHKDTLGAWARKGGN